jgi:hypothetical protein
MYLSTCLSSFAVWARWVLYASTALCLLLESIHLPPSIYYWRFLGAAYQSIRLSVCLSMPLYGKPAVSKLSTSILINFGIADILSHFVSLYIYISIYSSICTRVPHKIRECPWALSPEPGWALSPYPEAWALSPEPWTCIFVFVVNWKQIIISQN